MVFSTLTVLTITRCVLAGFAFAQSGEYINMGRIPNGIVRKGNQINNVNNQLAIGIMLGVVSESAIGRPICLGPSKNGSWDGADMYMRQLTIAPFEYDIHFTALAWAHAYGV